LLRVGGEDLPLRATLYNNDLLLRRGLGPLFDDAARQPAGRIGLFNTDPVLRETEIQSVVQGREVGLAGYNDYRAYCRFPRVTDFNQITGNRQVRDALRELYGDVDRIDFYVGLLAEDLRPNSALPDGTRLCQRYSRLNSMAIQFGRYHRAFRIAVPSRKNLKWYGVM
jgi:prostaglandin-endoperoxide synthase 2